MNANVERLNATDKFHVNVVVGSALNVFTWRMSNATASVSQSKSVNY